MTRQPASFHPPAACTILIVTIALERPFFALVESCHAVCVHALYLPGHILDDCWKRPRYSPVADDAVGSSPLSRFAMQIARAAPPPTGPKRSTVQVIRRRMRCATDSPDLAVRSQGPTPGFACVGAIVTRRKTRGRVTTVARTRLGTHRP